MRQVRQAAQAASTSREVSNRPCPSARVRERGESAALHDPTPQSSVPSISWHAPLLTLAAVVPHIARKEPPRYCRGELPLPFALCSLRSLATSATEIHQGDDTCSRPRASCIRPPVSAGPCRA